MRDYQEFNQDPNRDFEPDSTTQDEQEEDVKLPERRLSPFRKKQLDYKHQVRMVTSGNRGYRKALKLLPHIERRSFRRALDAATQAARRDEEAELTANDDLKTLKRASFSRLVARRALPLREALKRKREQRAERAARNRDKGRPD